MFATAGLVALGLPQAAVAQTFEEASFRTLDQITSTLETSAACRAPPSPDCWITPGSNIENLVNNAPAGVVSAAPATVSPQGRAGMAIERRLQAVRESEERRREAGLTRAIPASYSGDLVQAQLQLPPAGGATPEIVISQAQGFSVFAAPAPPP